MPNHAHDDATPDPQAQLRTDPPPPSPVVGYVRGGDSADREAARAVVAAACQRRGWGEVQWFEDAVDPDASGGSRAEGHRPGLERAAEALIGGGVLAIRRLDDLARSALDCIALVRRLHRRDAEIWAVEDAIDTTGEDKQTHHRLLEALATVEKQAVERGLSYGYVLGEDLQHVEIDPAQRRVVEHIVAWHAEGLTDEEIVEQLTRTAAPGPHGQPWRVQDVRRIVNLTPTSRWPAE